MHEVIKPAVKQLGAGSYVMTAAYEDQRAGTMVLSVFQCATEPILICVAARKGHPIEPLIRDSHSFAICKIDSTQKLMLRKFATDPVEGEDPFDSFLVERMKTGSPILAKADLVLDCEVVRHFDLEADHELFVGEVVAARIGARA
ncbi:MAG: flavin reductase [Planctomycetota bacterium]|nr:MAG: flavin reductase [Planctomycetota bacterium]